MSKRGQYCDLVWDQDGDPPAHYVYGHVTAEEFRATVERRYQDSRRGPIVVPPDAKIEHVYVRSVPSAGELEREIRHCGKRRGASPRTVWEIERTRASGG